MARRSKPSGLPDKGRRPGPRAVDTRPLRIRFLIVCEGGKTEPNYFRRFAVNANIVELVVEGLGDNTLSLVQQACDRMRQEDYDQVWCVFDRDSFPAERFNAALQLAGQRGIRVAYSNQAFGLWYLLHYDYHNVAASRHDYGPMLTERMGSSYRKNSQELYDLLVERQPEAILNAQRLLDFYAPDHNPERDNPCTTVHVLVCELNRYLR